MINYNSGMLAEDGEEIKRHEIIDNQMDGLEENYEFNQQTVNINANQGHVEIQEQVQTQSVESINGLDDQFDYDRSATMKISGMETNIHESDVQMQDMAQTN